MLGRLRATALTRSLDQSGWCTEGITGECFRLGIRASCSRQCVFRASSVLEPLLGSKENLHKHHKENTRPQKARRIPRRLMCGSMQAGFMADRVCQGGIESGVEKTCVLLLVHGALAIPLTSLAQGPGIRMLCFWVSGGFNPSRCRLFLQGRSPCSLRGN